MHVYIHVPFCARRCTYCDFAIAVRREVPSAAFADAVLAEWRRWQDDPAWAHSPGQLSTVYFGGGTPSRLAPSTIERMLAGLDALRPISPGAEITLEANPEDVTAPAARAWAAAGVNRVSLGAQSFDPGVLAWMHRTHSAEDIFRAVTVVRDAGIPELSLDLIFGLPDSLARDWQADLDRALALEPEHLSLYGLTVEAHTPLARQVVRGETSPADEDRYAAEFLAAHAALVTRGYEHYEVSNAARPGHRARHNSAYWRRALFIGLGPSAHSGFAAERRWNIREWSAWDAAVRAGRPTEAGRETLDPLAIRLESLYLGLRTTEGVPETDVDPATVARWEREGWATREGGRIRLTAEGWLRMDALVRDAA